MSRAFFRLSTAFNGIITSIVFGICANNVFFSEIQHDLWIEFDLAFERSVSLCQIMEKLFYDRINCMKTEKANSVFSAHPLRWKLLGKPWEFGDNQWLNEFQNPFPIPMYANQKLGQTRHISLACVCRLHRTRRRFTLSNWSKLQHQLKWNELEMMHTTTHPGINKFVRWCDDCIFYSKSRLNFGESSHAALPISCALHTHPPHFHLRLVVSFLHVVLNLQPTFSCEQPSFDWSIVEDKRNRRKENAFRLRSFPFALKALKHQQR